MTRMVLRSTVGADGVLHLDVPVGPESANKEIQVTLETVAKPPMTQEEWSKRVLDMAGRITDPTFVRPPQLPLEERDPLP